MAIADGAIADFSIAASPATTSNVSETTSATDAVSSLAVFASTITESVSAADAVTDTGTFNVGITEAASAVDTVNIGRPTFDATVTEAVTSTDSLQSTGPFHISLDEVANAQDTTDPVQKRLTWFLSFADVVPAPSGEGPGNPGKLFGDFALTQIYPNPNPRLR